MKRDWDLIRRILSELEEDPDIDSRLMSDGLDGWTQEETAYHIWLLIQSGLIVGKCNRETPGKGFKCYGACLTWQGHEFLAAVRNDTAWRQIRTILKDKAVDLSYESIKAAALSLLG